MNNFVDGEHPIPNIILATLYILFSFYNLKKSDALAQEEVKVKTKSFDNIV